MKKRKFSKVIAAALAAIMVVGMVPMMAFAANVSATVDTVKNADYYSKSISYEYGDDVTYLNYQYDGVDAATATATFDHGQTPKITLDDGEGYTSTASIDDLGWHIDQTIPQYSSATRTRTATGWFLSNNSDETAVWNSSTLTDESGSSDYDITLSGYATKGENGSGLQATDSASMTSTFTLPNDLEPGSYTLDINYTYHIKYSYSGFGTQYATAKNGSYSGDDMSFTGTDTITIVITETEYEGGDDEEEEPEITGPTSGIYEKTYDPETGIVTVTADSSESQDVTFGATLALVGEVAGYFEFSEDDDPVDVTGIPVTDELNVSFAYDGLENGKISVTDEEGISFSVTDYDASYTVSVTITKDLIKDILTAMGYGDYASLVDSMITTEFPITFEATAESVTPEFTTAYAVSVENEEDVYDITVTEEADETYSFTATDVPVGDYNIVVEYTLTCEFDYDVDFDVEFGMSLGSLSIPLGTINVTTSGSAVSRVISESDTLALTVECDHDYQISDSKPASCEDAGYNEYTCTKCGDSYTEEIEALGHDLDEGTVTTEAGCETEGVLTKSCQRDGCDYTETESIDALGHQYDVTTNATDPEDEDGYEYVEFTWEGTDDAEHIDEVTCTATFTCTACGEKTEVTCSVEEDKEKHADASCTEPEDVDLIATATIASREGDVTATDETHVKGIILGHDPDYTKETIITAPTCMSEGLAMYPCTRCGEDVEEVLPKTEHKYVVAYTVEPTCTEAGAYYYACQCDSCGDECTECNPETLELEDGSTISYAYTSERPALGHTVVTDEAVDPTCTETGLTEGSHCSVCEETLVAQEVIPATGHDYGEPEFNWTVSRNSVTCPTTITCANCGEVVEGEVVLESETIKAATCTEEGKDLYTATAAFEIVSDNDRYYDDTAEVEPDSIKPLAVKYITYTDTYEKTVSETGHSYDYDNDTVYNWNDDYTACTAVTTCSVCGEVVETNECTIDVVETPATCTEDGSIVYTATFSKVFGIFTYSESVTVPIPATGHELTYVEAVEATETEDGNVEYWYCENCGCYYLDADATEEVSAMDVIISALEPSETEDNYVKDIAGESEDGAVFEVHASLLGEDFYVPDITAADKYSVSTEYNGIGENSLTMTAASGSTAMFGITDLGWDYSVEVTVDADMLTPILNEYGLGGLAGTIAGLLGCPFPVYGEDYTIAAEYVAYATDAAGNVYYFDVEYDPDDPVTATFTCPGLADGDYELTVEYTYTFGFSYAYSDTVMSIAVDINGTVDDAHTVTGSDTFTLSVFEGGSSGSAGGSSSGSTESGTESGTEAGTESGTEAGTETGEGEVETGDAEHEHDFYIVDSAEATCEDQGWVLYACSECGEQFTQYTAALGHDYVDGVCTRCGAIDPDYEAPTDETEDEDTTEEEDEFTEAEGSDEEAEDEEEDEFTEVEEDEFDVVSDESLTSPQTGASMAAIGAAMAFAAAGIVVVTRKKKEDE